MSKPNMQSDGDRDKLTPQFDIVRGAELGDLAEVAGALEADPDSIRFQEPRAGLTAMHIAAANGDLTVVQKLLEAPGLDLTIQDYFGRNALDLAIGIGHRQVIDAISRRLYPKSFQDEPDLD